jgi:cell wall-associated NlpC family hydrolase
LRFRFIVATLSSIATLAAGAPAALAANPGGVSATTPSTVPAAAHRPALHLDPVTSRTSNLAYSGPVYQRTAAGEVVPYQPATTASQASVTTAAAPSATTGGSAAGTTGTTVPVLPATPAGPVAKPELLVPGTLARYVGGLAAAPIGAPLAIQQIIWAGNELVGLPYIYGGGHASFISPGYDCSGTVSFALHGANLLQTPEDSSEFMVTGSHGIGRWVSIFSNPEHAYMTVAGLRLDTSSADDPSNQQGPRWRPLRPANPGFTVRHPLGL